MTPFAVQAQVLTGGPPSHREVYAIVATKMIATAMPTGVPILRRGISGGGGSRWGSSERGARNPSPNLSPL